MPHRDGSPRSVSHRGQLDSLRPTARVRVIECSPPACIVHRRLGKFPRGPTTPPPVVSTSPAASRCRSARGLRILVHVHAGHGHRRWQSECPRSVDVASEGEEVVRSYPAPFEPIRDGSIRCRAKRSPACASARAQGVQATVDLRGMSVGAAMRVRGGLSLLASRRSSRAFAAICGKGTRTVVSGTGSRLTTGMSL